MQFRKLIILVFVLICGVVTAARAGVTVSLPAEKASTVIPFEFVHRHIFLRIKVNNSDPLWFVFDTGDKFAIVDLERAKLLGLNLQGQINVGGAGAGVLKGAYVKDASFTVPGLDGFSQPVTLAVPLDILEPNFGHDVMA
ncbi:MAG TPA: aspartyl protease family protein [Blastocatellia bacterium]|nr:aspartyl protease family protein [Blastocatellia bacterium]